MSNSGFFVTSEHSGQRIPTQTTQRFSWPSPSASLAVGLISCLFASCAAFTSYQVLSELRIMRASQHAHPTRSSIDALVKLELQGAVSTLQAEMKSESAATLTILREVQQKVSALDLIRHGSELRASIDTGLNEHAAAVSKSHDALGAQLAAKFDAQAAQSTSQADVLAKIHDKLATLERTPPPTHMPPPSPPVYHAPPPLSSSSSSSSSSTSSSTSSSSSSSSSRSADGRRLSESTPPGVVHSIAPAPPKASPSTFVKVTFRYKPTGLPGNHALLYWLGNSKVETEHLYADVPPGMEVLEMTRPGECWRVRDATTGNDLLPRYCATAQPTQLVEITAQKDVVVDFLLPKEMSAGLFNAASTDGRGPAPSAIELYEDATSVAPQQHTKASRVGTLSRGAHLAVQTHAGAKFTAREVGTGRLIASFAASTEAKQYATIGHGAAVSIEFASPRDAAKAVSLYHVRDDGEEHLHAKLAPRTSLRVETEAGERWVVREPRADKQVLTLTASAEAFQRIDVPKV